jgi:predicted flap endonuclease-1-like 5' DNA nuclease
MVNAIEAKRTETGRTTATTIDNANKSYAAVGALVVAGLLIVGVLGYVGVNGPGVLETSPAFFVLGSSILILAGASLYLLFTLRSTIRVVQVHEQFIAKSQANRDVTQDDRLTSLEGTRTNAYANPTVSAQLAPLEVRVASLERARSATTTISAGPTNASAARGGAASASVVMVPAIQRSPFGDVSPVIDVQGIGPVFAQALDGMGIHDTRDLWAANAAAIATSLDAPLSTVHKWQQMAELIAIKGIGPQYAELLQRSGVGSIAELRGCESKDLLERVTETQAGLEVRIQGNTIGNASVSSWIQAARDHKGA